MTGGLGGPARSTQSSGCPTNHAQRSAGALMAHRMMAGARRTIVARARNPGVGNRAVAGFDGRHLVVTAMRTTMHRLRRHRGADQVKPAMRGRQRQTDMRRRRVERHPWFRRFRDLDRCRGMAVTLQCRDAQLRLMPPAFARRDRDRVAGPSRPRGDIDGDLIDRELFRG